MKPIIFLTSAVLALAACSQTKFNQEGSSQSSESAQNSNPLDTKKQKNPDQARSDCQYLKLGLAFLADPLAANSSVDGLIGSGIYSATTVLQINRITGSVIVLGTAPDAKIGLLSLIDGSALICDMDVMRVENVAGSVIVVNGTIGAVHRVTGSVLAVDGAVQGPVTDSIGSVLSL